MGDSVDKIYHTPISTFLYNVLSPSSDLKLVRSLRPTDSVHSSPIAVGPIFVCRCIEIIPTERISHDQYRGLQGQQQAIRAYLGGSKHLLSDTYASAGGIYPYGTICACFSLFLLVYCKHSPQVLRE